MQKQERTCAVLVLPSRMSIKALTLISAVLEPLCKPAWRDLVNSRLAARPGLLTAP